MTVILYDGSNLLWRSALSKHASGMSRRDGTPTGAVVTFVSAMLSIADRYSATHGAVVFDGPGPSFRSQMLGDYKGNREHQMPPEAEAQIPQMRESVQHAGFTLINSAPYEADDVIATLATRFRRAGKCVVVVSDDKDLGCLVCGKQVVQHRLCDARGGKESPTLDETSIRARWGVAPNLIGDVQALCGDSVDSLRGVSGVGPVYAKAAIAKYGSVEAYALAAADGKGKKWPQRAGAMTGVSLMSASTRLITDAAGNFPIVQRPLNWPTAMVRFLESLEAESAARALARRHGLQRVKGSRRTHPATTGSTTLFGQSATR